VSARMNGMAGAAIRNRVFMLFPPSACGCHNILPAAPGVKWRAACPATRPAS
jgi:hypothetical protein